MQSINTVTAYYREENNIRDKILRKKIRSKDVSRVRKKEQRLSSLTTSEIYARRAEYEVRTPPRGSLWGSSQSFSLSSAPRVAQNFGRGAATSRGQRGPRWCIAVRKPGIRRARWRLNGVKVSGVGNRAGTLGAVSGEEDRTWPRRGSGRVATARPRTLSFKLAARFRISILHLFTKTLNIVPYFRPCYPLTFTNHTRIITGRYERNFFYST